MTARFLGLSSLILFRRFDRIPNEQARRLKPFEDEVRPADFGKLVGTQLGDIGACVRDSGRSLFHVLPEFLVRVRDPEIGTAGTQRAPAVG